MSRRPDTSQDGDPAWQFATPDQVGSELRAAGYLPDERISSVVYLGDRLGKPVLVEGPAGTGKTELAKSVAALTGRRLIRLQCYEGLDEAKALYEWNYRKQLLRIQAEERGAGWESVQEDIFSEDFLMSRPLLTARPSAPRLERKTMKALRESARPSTRLRGSRAFPPGNQASRRRRTVRCGRNPRSRRSRRRPCPRRADPHRDRPEATTPRAPPASRCEGSRAASCRRARARGSGAPASARAGCSRCRGRATARGGFAARGRHCASAAVRSVSASKFVALLFSGRQGIGDAFASSRAARNPCGDLARRRHW